ncbi:hypothetical protein BU17DRAFT_47102 [Hysterangium stoloniferum]|nr:hypothetical protein BU17DRAFT_47102 [Hysterangium stoloniferum]
MDLLKTDDLTVVLAVCFVAVYGISKFLKPASLVHPLLLGRQADVGRVRMPGESAIYRNYATGIIGRLPERPKPEVKLLSDLLPDDNVAPRRLWSTTTTNAELKERADALGVGLTQVVGLVPRESTALLLLDDSIEFLVTDLALANNSITSFTLSSISLLVPILKNHTPTTIIIRENLLENLLERVTDMQQSTHHSIIVVGDEKQNSVPQAQKSGIRILRWEDLETKGKSTQKLVVPPPGPDDIFTVSFYDCVDGFMQNGMKLFFNLSQNVTAGITAGRMFFPLTDPISSLDSLLSMFPMSTPFGRSIAYTALYQGANYTSFPTVIQLDQKRKPFLADLRSESDRLLEFCMKSSASPTLLFLTSNNLKPVVNGILGAAKSNFLYNLAWRHKVSALREGFLTKISFWDNLVWGHARSHVLDKIDLSLRGIVVSEGALDSAELETARIALSVSIVFASSHPLVCGPITMSHPFDLQSFPTNADSVTHLGPPSPNIEAKLVEVTDSSIEQGGDPTGFLSIRGPSVSQSLGQSATDSESWLATGRKALIQTNGTFKFL